ncbi:PRC-barrel domain-containing protein [Pseudoroseicyclus sp. H15]
MIGKALIAAFAVTGVAAVAMPSTQFTEAAMNETSIAATPVPASALTFTGINVDELVYAPVLDMANQRVGEVAELFIDGSGRIDGAVVSVGGMFSSHKVALDLADLEVLQAPGEGFVVRTNLSEDSLTAMPTFES